MHATKLEAMVYSYYESIQSEIAPSYNLKFIYTHER